MSKQFLRYGHLVILMACAAAVFTANTAWAAGTSLDGSFERSLSGAPMGWTMNDLTRNHWVAELGNHFVRIVNTDPKSLTFIQGAVPVPAATRRVRVAFRVRTKNLQVGTGGAQDARVMMFFADASGKQVGDWQGIKAEDSFAWTVLKTTLDVPAGATQLILRPGLYNATGTLDVDDVTVAPFDPGSTFDVAPATGASIDETQIKIFLYVDGAKGRDTNPGTEDLPFATIRKGLVAALAEKKQGHGVKLLIAAGTYREGGIQAEQFTSDAPLIIQAAEPGKVILSGADVWTGWQRVGGHYEHSWPYKWGFATHPWKQYQVKIGPMAERSELVLVNGKRLHQYETLSQLSSGGFVVDERASKIYIQPVSGQDLAKSTVEVATRLLGMTLSHGNNIVLRGLTLRGYANTIFIDPSDNPGGRPIPIPWYGGMPLGLGDLDNILVEDCRFDQNNWDGLSFGDMTNVTLHRVVAADNGGSGFSGSVLTNLLIDDVTVARNNWRGFMGGFTGWAVGSPKLLEVHGATLRNLKSLDNDCYGLWFDTRNEDLLIENYLSEGNRKSGLYLEWCPGPIVVRNSIIRNNRGSGMHISGSSNIWFDHVQCVGNATQITMRDDDRNKAVNFKMTHCVIASEPLPPHQSFVVRGDENNYPSSHSLLDGQDWVPSYQYWTYPDLDVNTRPLFMPSGPRAWKLFLSSLQASGNTFYHPDIRHAFFDTDRYPIDFGAWQALIGDKTAQWQNPVGITRSWQDMKDALTGKSKPPIPDAFTALKANPSATLKNSGAAIRIDCGSSKDYIDQDGNLWLADQVFVSGQSWGAVTKNDRIVDRKSLVLQQPDAPIFKTKMRDVYLTERYDMNGYLIGVPEGKYSLRLHFAEEYEGVKVPGDRIFDVLVNGENVLPHLDVFKEAGGRNIPLSKTIADVQAKNGQIKVEFAASLYGAGPMIDGIEVIRQ